MAANIEKRKLSLAKQTLNFLSGVPLFAGLANEEIERFADAARMKSFKKGKVLYLQDDKAEYFYIICSGWLKLFHTTQEGDEVILAMLSTEGIIGKSSIFEHGHYSSSAQIIEDAELLSIPLSILSDRLRLNNQLALNMLSSMIRYQRVYERQLEQHLLYSAPQRIGCFLMGLCPVLEQQDGVILKLPYDKTLIASALGMKGATFSRALNILREETGIHITGTRVKIDSIKRLLDFLDGSYSNYLPKKLAFKDIF